MARLAPEPRRLSFAVLTLALFACLDADADITSGNAVSGPVTFGSVTVGSYDFTDFGGSYQASLVQVTATGTATGTININMTGSADYLGVGDRMLLALTNNSGSTWNSVTFVLTGTTFDPRDNIDPSRGTFSSNTYTSDAAQRLNTSDVSLTNSNAQVSITFDSPVANGSTTYFYLPVFDVQADPTMTITPGVGTPTTTPAPSAWLLAILGIGLLPLLYRRVVRAKT